jgi:hypothetical protein
METRKLRIVKPPLPAIGVCEECGFQFQSSLLYSDADIQKQFDAHECEPVDSSLNARKVPREAADEY